MAAFESDRRDAELGQYLRACLVNGFFDGADVCGEIGTFLGNLFGVPEIADEKRPVLCVKIK